MDRRTYLKSTGAAVTGLTLAGCLGGGGGDGEATTTESETTTESGDGEATTTEESSDLPSKVVIGSDIPYKPFEYYTNQDELEGFDVDIAEALFPGELGIEYEFKPTSFDTIIPSLKNGNFRIIMSAMTITDKRAEEVDFSDPYFTAYQTIVVAQDSDISTKEALKGKTVGVQKGTTGADAADGLKEEFGGDLNIKRYDQIPDAFNALLNNQVVAVVNDNTVNAEFVNQNSEKVRFVEGEGAAAEAGQEAPPYLTLTVENYGIAFRKDDDAFLEKVNEALAAIKDSGKYDEIYGNYFQG